VFTKSNATIQKSNIFMGLLAGRKEFYAAFFIIAALPR
jgi:hypothetical protein